MSANAQRVEDAAAFADSGDPFLSGNFAPIGEERTFENLEIVGTLPRELEGAFIRIGPNPQFPPKGRYHWFDGDGMLHGTFIRDGTATYRNRYVRTSGFLREREAGRALWTGLAEMPSPDNPEMFKNVANTALVWHDCRLLALWEAGLPHQIRVPSLETVGVHDYGGALTHAFTAHPKVDPATGEMMFFGYSPVPPFLTYSVVSKAGAIVHTEQIEIPAGVMMHDFAVTEHYSIFLDLPLIFSLERMMQGQSPLQFEPDFPARFGIMPRHGTNADVRWFEGPSCYIFHTVNAYEEGDEVVLHASRMQRTAVLADVDADTVDDGALARMHRWRFNLKSGATREEPLDDDMTEFGRINERYVGRKNRYGFTAHFERVPGPPRMDGLTKYDYQTGAIARHFHGPHRYGGEGVFVPRPGATAEDDGWLVTYVHDERERTDEMVFVNAQNVSAPPGACIRIPGRIPYGFHGAWVSGATMRTQR
jgi:carotenoid cleavage dioxygenase